MNFAKRFPLALLFATQVAAGHGGGLNADGCHHNRKTGDYHCHRGGAAPAAAAAPASAGVAAGSAKRPERPARLAGATGSAPAAGAHVQGLPPGCFVGPRGGTYTISATGRKNYGGC